MKSSVNQTKTIVNTKELNGRLVDAAYKGELELIKELVEQENADLNSNESGPKPPLISAANNGQTEVVKYLVAKGAKLDIRAEYGRNSLMYSVSDVTKRRVKDYLSTAEFLIQSGVDVNAVDEDAKTALIYAIERRNLEAAKLLIANGAKVNIVDKNGDTPLIYALGKMNEDTNQYIKILIQAGADVKTPNKKNETPLRLAASFSSGRQSVELLIQAGADRNDLFLNGTTELMYAVKWRDFQWADKLIKEGADINKQDQSGGTALMIAAKNNDNDLIKYLIQAGAKINIQDNYGYSAILYSSFDKEIFSFLIESGADINIISNVGETVLSKAIDLGCKEIIKQLLEMNIKKEIINKKGKGSWFRDGYTPLGYVTELLINRNKNKYRDIAILLLKSGANPNIMCDGYTALNLLSKLSADEELMQLLSPFKEMQEADLSSHY